MGDTTTTILVLLRHGDAGDPLPSPELDARRALSSRGRKQARRAGKALRRLGLAPAAAHTSRLRRASETLALALEACGGSAHVVRTSALAPDADPGRTGKLLAATPRAEPDSPPAAAAPHASAPAPLASVGPTDAAPAAGTAPAPETSAAEPAPAPVHWLVGHDPHLTRFLAHLLGTAPEALRLSKGAFAVVALDARGAAAGAGTLISLVPADGLKVLARKRRKKKQGKRRAGKRAKKKGAR